MGRRTSVQSVKNELGLMDATCRNTIHKRFTLEKERGIMNVNGISEISSSTVAWAGTKASSEPATSSSSAATSQTASASSSLSSASTGLSSSSDEAQPSVSSVQVTTIVATYSTTVGGKNYSESVEKLGEEYVVSVPNPPGASASGLSVQSAENNLSSKLDTLV
jgi:hypothetical protein